jgi:uncharacterized membrane protein
MKTKLIYLLLILSLGFNVFFIAGYIKEERKAGDTTTGRQGKQIELAAKRLKLSEMQKIKLDAVIRNSRQKIGQLKARQRATVLLFRSELAKETPDVKKMKKAMDEIDRRRKNLRREISNDWKNFFASLSPEQQEKVKKMLRLHPELRKKFMIY